VHRISVETLFDEALVRGMRVIAGKVMMDQLAPDGLRDDVDGAERDNLELIARWHGRGRLAYALTPRFAMTSSIEQLAMAGRLLAAQPDLYMQTHVAENRDEVREVLAMFPRARSYLDVYAGFGLMHERSLFAHGIWLDDTDRAVLAAAGAQIAHSPSSNLFLGSGLFDWHATQAAGVAVSLASDVGGGTSLCMPRNMLDAYKIQALAGRRLTAHALLHAATRGAARALHLAGEVGSFEPGTLADVVVWDWAVDALGQRRQAVARDLHDRLFAWMTLADERHVASVRVAGVERYRRGAVGRSEE
jgi:guanine deaminase